jgi:hypothetical protein
MKAQKGTFLTSLIVIFGIAITFASVILLFDQGARQSLGNLPGWFNLFVIGLLVGRWIALYAIWDLRRWGVYVLLVLEIMEISFGLFVYAGDMPLPARIFVGVPMFLAVLVIWYLALRPKWQLFA